MSRNRNSKLGIRNSQADDRAVGGSRTTARHAAPEVCHSHAAPRHSRDGRNSLRLALLLASLSLVVSPASAQVATGVLPYASLSGGPDLVNNANLNVHLSMPVVGKAGRAGLRFASTLTYDSSIWYPNGTSGDQIWVQNPTWGWNGMLTGQTGYVTENRYTEYCTVGGTKYPYGEYVFGPYVDPQGTSHPVSVTTISNSTECGYGQPMGSSLATDGSGYKLVVANFTAASIILPSGEAIVPAISMLGNLVSGTWTDVDSNGNLISVKSTSTTTTTDTLGTTALTVSGSGTPSSPITLTYTAASGNQATATMNYTAYTVATSFGCSGISEYGPNGSDLVSSIVLPDGTSYSFTYEVTPGDNHNPHYVTGRVASITLPTGGTISYSYSGGSNGITCADGSAATLTRTTPDGTWTYAHSENGAAWTTTLTDPQSNVTTFNFQGIYETERQVAGLETIYTCYGSSGNSAPSFPCNSTAVALPITQRAVTTSLGGLEAQTVTTYDWNWQTNADYGLVTEVDNYGYGSGAVGSLVRKTVTVYNTSLGNNIVNRPSTVSTYNGSGTLLLEYSYSYDGSGLTSTSGTPQHSNPSGSRGNLTGVTISGSGFSAITNSTTYFDTGGTYVATDFDGAQTTYNSGTGVCGNSFDTTISLPMSLSQSMAWTCNGALETSTTDANNNTTDYAYDNMNRLIQTSYPDGGVTNIEYTGATVKDVCKLISGSLSGCTPGSGSVFRHDQTDLDGLGRTIHQDLVSDPAGETYVDTTYDSLGRLYTKSNPYRSTSDPTYGLDTDSYDALNRITKVTHADSSYSQVSYGSGTQTCSASTYGYGYSALYTDESGNQRQTFTDALGRVIEVDEPNPSNGNSLTWNTCYTYDALGNLTGVVQGSETRSYSYDGLSRMTLSTTPEGGTTNYYYTASGGLCANNPKLVCSKTDARGITTTYTYDGLNRLTGKSYSSGDPSVTYYYDQSSYNGLTISNGKGLRTGMSDGSGQTAWSYDKMGRIVAEERTIAGITKTMDYGYELDGSLASITYPSGRVVGYSYGNDARPISSVDSADSINYATSATYAPPGGLASIVNGEVSGGFAGITTSNSYNNRLFPTSLTASSSNGTALSLSYTYFANGNVNVETNGRDNGRTATYTYDALNRVSTATSQATSGSDCWGQSFGYDRYANLTTINVTQCTALMLSLSVNTNNQITNSGFTYDADGDLTNDGTYAYTWNAEQHLTSAASVNYTYDGDLRRVEKSNGTLFWYCAVCGQVLAESDLSGNLTSEYTFFNRQRIARRDISSGNVYYLFHDRLGSYRTLTNSTGSVQGESDYYPFSGERVISSTTTDNFRFAGMEWDSEDGLNHTLYRQFTSGQGRWETPDPKRGSVMNPQSQNLYSYVRDNPTNGLDASGLQSCPPGCVPVEQPDPGLPICDCSPMGGGGAGGCPNFVGGAIRPDLMPVCPSPPSNGGAGGKCVTPAAQRSVLASMIRKLSGCLEKDPSCLSWIAQGTGASYALNYLTSANFSIGNLGAGGPAAKTTITWTSSSTGPQETASTEVNSVGAFFCRGWGDLGYGFYGAPGIGGDTSQGQALTLLHELGHVAGVIGSDATVAGQTANNQAVMSHCSAAINCCAGK